VSLLPLGVRLAGLPVLCVGAGPVAAAKLLPMVEGGARATVVAPDAVPELREAAAAGRLTWHARAWAPADLDGAALVVAATADPSVNEAVTAAAAGRATLCVRADVEGEGTADVLAAVRRGPLLLAVSTEGNAPVLARHLRQELAASYGPEWGELVALFGELRRDPDVRAALRDASPEQRRVLWRSIPVADILSLIRKGQRVEAKRVASACLSSSSG
jgi:siroheme synthase-like protein